MRLLGLILLFLLVPFVELYVILEVVGPAIGAPWTILLLAADSIIGALLFRSQGRAVWRQFTEAMATGRIPHREVVDGILVIFGGAFLVTPGFLTDIFGIAMLLPPTRALLRPLVLRVVRRRMEIRMAAAGRVPRGDYDVEGSASEYEPPPRELRR